MQYQTMAAIRTEQADHSQCWGDGENFMSLKRLLKLKMRALSELLLA